jgi:hypothetical protein
MVRDVDVTPDDYITAVASSLEQGGWFSGADAAVAARELTADLTDIADSFPAGAFVCRPPSSFLPLRAATAT